jgi:hypothetical protein
MKIKYSKGLIAIAALVGSTGVAMAADTSSFDASVSVLSPDQSGFLIGGQVAVNGVGTGALTMSRSAATMVLNGGAASQLDPNALAGRFGVLDSVTSTADITSSLSFDRSITTSGALVGLGSVIARGEAIGALGSAGAASANTTTAGTRAAGALGGPTDLDVGGEGNATADASAQGSLNGSLSTSNTLQLLGTSGLFAGSNGLTVGENNTALAYGSSGVTSDGVTGINLSNADTETGLAGTGNGGLFNLTSALTGSEIALAVTNAGNGSVSITTSTGGFFTGGGAAAGSATFADTASFFAPSLSAIEP